MVNVWGKARRIRGTSTINCNTYAWQLAAFAAVILRIEVETDFHPAMLLAYVEGYGAFQRSRRSILVHALRILVFTGSFRWWVHCLTLAFGKCLGGFTGVKGNIPTSATSIIIHPYLLDDSGLGGLAAARLEGVILQLAPQVVGLCGMGVARGLPRGYNFWCARIWPWHKGELPQGPRFEPGSKREIALVLMDWQ